MAASTDSSLVPSLSLRQSIAPRVVDNSLPMATLVSTHKFSVRVASPDAVQCSSSSSSILTTFLWKDPGIAVYLAGSFDGWRKHEMMYIPEVQYHILVTELPPGDYFYRFVVDGRWRVADGDPNLQEDQFGQVSHFVSINPQAVASVTAAFASADASKRFSTAALSHAPPVSAQSDAVHDEGDSDTECEDDDDDDVDDDDQASSAPISPDLQSETDLSRQKAESIRLSRKRGSTYIGDYDDDQYAGLDLQQDVFEAMKDMAEVNPSPKLREPSPTRSPVQDSSGPRRTRRRPGVRMLRRVWGMLFGDSGGDENVSPNNNNQQRNDVGEPGERLSRPTHNQKAHGLVTHESALKKGLKVWFPNERNFPAKSGSGRKVAPEEKVEVVDAGDRALKLHQVEENANNRQMLGKNLFAQGKYDAALALFSLSVKLREDNGLKYAKTTAIAHTDVASAFIHLDDLKNAEKHLIKALAIFNKGTFSGGKAQLGDVHCFLGVIGDMRGDLKAAEKSYRSAIELYKKCKMTNDNPNHATAIENLNANLRRQRTVGSQPGTTVTIEKSNPTQSSKSGGNNDSDDSLRHQKTHPAPKQAAGNNSLQSQRSHPPKQKAHHQATKQENKVHNQHAQKNDSNRTKASQQRSTGAKPLAPSRPPPLLDSSLHQPAQQTQQHHQPHGHAQQSNQAHQSPPTHESDAYNAHSPAMSMGSTIAHSQAGPPTSQRQSQAKPSTWKGLADTARASMPQHPPASEQQQEDDEEPPAGSYEEMCRMWHKDARALLFQGKYKEAIDLYTLIVYTRKRHGPWNTRRNVDSLVEFARALFATRDLEEAVKTLRDAIDILEKLDCDEDKVSLGEVWGNLGSVLDRVKGKQDEALSAHCAGMVAYGKSGMSSEDPKWKKAWKGLCMHLKVTGRLDKAEEIWHSVDLQIRGVAPMTKVSSAILR